MHFGSLGGRCAGWDIVRFCYVAVIVVHMFMLQATMDIWYLHVLLTIQSLTINHRGRILLAPFVTMDDGVEFPSQLLSSHPEISHGFDEFLKSTTACIHTHTCNPLGPSAAMHTHTCLHSHTHVIASGKELRKPQKSLGNREAVRKYREKKKAHAAFLEEEVKKLRATNQELLRRLQGHAALEAEVVRLRGLLFDVRGKIEAEIGSFQFQKHCGLGSVVCTDPTHCFNAVAEVAAWEANSEPTILDYEIDESDRIS
ncbi:hypothetical protein U9M48_017432 [Paspalum notatum var. saurae]|uniref:BZIP domain-containing protein n=1 Tax=Paspalum notatum var. saurae TaxID=547442 RepID=A0AAQ3T7R7_PASNO